MKIAFFEIKNWEKAYIKKTLKKHDLLFINERLSLDNVNKAKQCKIVTVFIDSKVNKKILSKLPKVKMIATRSTGYDHISIKDARLQKIIVCNVPTYGENTVAEHTFALILALSRNVHKSYVRSRNYDFSIQGLKGFDLKGKTIGVIGAGHIGLHVIKMAKGFGMNVLSYSKITDQFLSEVMDFHYVSLDTLLEKSDIVSLHVPYNKYTHHLIGRKEFQKMKKGAVLINTARGGVVDTHALLEALDTKKLAGAGLDVLEGEEFIKEDKAVLHSKKHSKALQLLITKNHIILNKDNVVYTPHIAFYSEEALQRILEITAKNILYFINGKARNIVNG